MPRKIINKGKYGSYDLLSSMTADGSTYNKHANLYAWYQMGLNNSTSQVPDLSGNGQTINKTTGAEPRRSNDQIDHKVPGFPDGSFEFTSDRLTYLDTGTGARFTFTSDFSGSAWIKALGRGTIMSKVLVTSELEFNFNIHNNNLRLILYTDLYNTLSFTLDLDFEFNKWTHVGFAFDESEEKVFFYINGEKKGPSAGVTGVETGIFTGIPDTDADFTVGGYDPDSMGAASNGFQGFISEVALWDTLLVESDFAAIYKTVARTSRSGFVNFSPRIEIINRDNATGSYPTILRMGDKDRRGSYSTQFDDTNTILFGRRIRDNFELKEEDKESGILGYTKKINTRDWTQSGDLEIRRELISSSAGSTAKDGALVLAGAGDASGHRWIQTKVKIKNPTLEAEVIFGPYNEQRTVLKHGLGLKSPGSTEARGLKIQVSTNGSAPWTTIKTLTGDAESLFALSSFSSRSAFEALLQKRKRTKIKLTPSDFSGVAGSEFYLRFAQESVSDPNQVEWAIGYVNIDYHKEDVRYPLMINPVSRVGQRIVNGAIATPHELPTLTAPGRSISGISDVHLKFTPGEGISAFDDSRINIVPENFFFQQGSDPEDVRGLSSPLWSKTQFVVDLSPNEETTFGMTNRTNHSDDTIKQQLMVYWNNNLKRWEKISQGISSNQAGASSDSLENMILSGALGFGSIDVVSTGSDATEANQEAYDTNILNSYARPTSTFGFPFEGKYHATGSQSIKASDLGITKPFVLEKCQIAFDSKFEFADANDSARAAYNIRVAHDQNTIENDENAKIFIPTFFILRQQNFDSFDKEVAYKTQVRGSSLATNTRGISIPALSRLGASAEETYVTSSRELITYGQVSLYASSSVATHKFNFSEVFDRGLSRDLNINILELNNQPGWGLLGTTGLDPVTSSFTMNFPSRVTGKINAGSRITVEDSSGLDSSIWLNNSIGGRSYGNLDSSARAIVNGYPTGKDSGTYLASNLNAGSAVSVDLTPAESVDLASPYIIMPNDEIVFGWQYPAPFGLYNGEPGNSDDYLHSMTLFGGSKLILFGSQLKDSVEFHETNNQNLSSDGVHELIGSEPVVDQFEVSRAIENFGNYLDNYVATSTEEPVKRVRSLVQSRLTTPKGSAGHGVAIIQFPRRTFFPAANNPGMNDGDVISIKDGLGQVGHFYALRYSPFYPLDASGNPPHRYDADGDNSVDTTSVSFTWSSSAIYPRKYIHHFTADPLDVVTTGFMYGHRWPATNYSIQYPVSNGADNLQPDGDPGTEPDFIYAFKLEGGDDSGTGSSESERLQTLENLLEAINDSPLRMTGQASDDIIGGPKLVLNLTDSGTASQYDIIYLDAKDDLYSGLQDDYLRPSVTGFSGGDDNLIVSSLGSFVRISPTQDGTRVYADSLLTNSSIGFSNSSFGTMQTSGEEIRPKYYLDTRKYGQSAHFLEQGKDSKSDFNLKTRRTGLINVLKGESLGSPVRVEFVSGSTSDSTATRSFRRRSSSQTTSVNKTINSVLTGAFYDA